MKRIIQKLLIFAVVAAFCGTAQGETMAERKQRIMRKYLRERQTVVQTGLIPETTGENEQVLESEKYQQQAKMDISRNERTSPPLRPVVRPIPVQARRQNWMLEDENKDFDPNADPFALDAGDGVQEEKKNWWTQWQERQEMYGSDRQSANASENYGDRRDNAYTRRSIDGYRGSEYQRSSRNDYGSTFTTRNGSNPSTSSTLGPYSTSSYGTSPSSGMLTLPPPSRSTETGSQTTDDGYTPYKSPFLQDQQDRRSMQATPPTQQQEFTRPSPYKQWKDNNKAWDPTADDAYVDELMRHNRR